MPKILIADDFRDIREMLRIMFNQGGYTADAAADGPEAVQLFYRAHDAGKPYSAVIVDAAMPAMTGFETAACIRSIDGDVPIMLLTGYGDTLTRPHAKAVGITEIVQKPVAMDELKGKIAALIGTRETCGQPSH